MPLTKRYKLGEFDFVMDLARSLNLLLPRLPGLPLFFFPCSVGAYRSGLFLSRFVPSFRCLVPFSLFFFFARKFVETRRAYGSTSRSDPDFEIWVLPTSSAKGEERGG